MLIESEYVGNKQIADALTALGHPIGVEDAIAKFMGLSGRPFFEAIEAWIGKPIPEEFHRSRRQDDERVLREGLQAVAGAIAFVEALPADLPCAIASSSSREWIRTHLEPLRLRRRFEPHIFSGKEDVARSKPAPDIYLHAAAAMGVPIERVAIIEDSPVGVAGAVASGAFVIGLVAGSHCFEGHAGRLKALGAHVIAHDFEEVTAALA